MDKEKQPDKICCTICKKYKSISDYLKQVKQCIECRDATTAKRKAKKGTVESSKEGSNNNDNYNVIDIVEIFNYIKNKHKDVINYSLEDIIQEINEMQEIDVEEQSQEEEE